MPGVRESHLKLKTTDTNKSIEQKLSKKEHLIKPLETKRKSSGEKEVIQELSKRHPELIEPPVNGFEYKLIEDSYTDSAFINTLQQDKRLVVMLNKNHKFYKKIYKSLSKSDDIKDKEKLELLQMMILSAARAYASNTKKSDKDSIDKFMNS